MNLLIAIGKFRLGLIPASWMKNVWNSGFNGDFSLPNEYKSHLNHFGVTNLIDIFINAIKRPKNARKKMKPISWTKLINKVKYRRLLCLLSCFINKKDVSNNNLWTKLKWVRLYINLLSIPGAHSHKIFNSVLFYRAMDIIRLGYLMIYSNNQESPNDNYENKKRDMFEFWLLMKDLRICFKHFKFKKKPNSFSYVLEIISFMTACKKRCNILETPVKGLDNANKIAFISYLILHQLCSSDHGNTTETANILLKYILPSLNISEKTMRLPSNEKEAIQNTNFTFIKRLTIYGEAIAHPIYLLACNLLLGVSWKAEMRAEVVAQLLKLMNIYNYDLIKSITHMLVRSSQIGSIRHKICAVEVISWKLTSVNEGEDLELMLYKFLLGLIFAMSVENTPLIRYKCLRTIAELISSKNVQVNQIMTTIFNSPTYNETNKTFFDFASYIKSNNQLDNIIFPDDPLPSGYWFMTYVKIYAKDNNLYVKKSALQVITNLLVSNVLWISPDLLQSLSNGCADKSTMIRRLVITSLTELALKYPEIELITREWVSSVVPVVNDIDIETRDSAIKCMKIVILDNVAVFRSILEDKLAWKAIGLIEKSDLKNCLTTALSTWSTQNLIRITIYEPMMDSFELDNWANLVWFFLVSLSEVTDFPEPDFIYEYFCRMSLEQVEHRILDKVLHALELNQSRMSSDNQLRLVRLCKESISNFQIPCASIQRFFNIGVVCPRTPENVKFCRDIVKKCETYLRNEESTGLSSNSILTCRVIASLGIANNLEESVTLPTITHLTNIFSRRLDGGICCMLGIQVYPNDVRAAAISTLGKICLSTAFLVKQCINIFIVILNNSMDFLPARKNCMWVLCDLYVRFPQIVGVYLNKMFLVIKDPCIEMRLHSFKLITQLVKTDAVKLSEYSFLYVLSMAVDESDDILLVLGDLFKTYILRNNKNIMCEYFVAAIFFFNGYFGTNQITNQDVHAFCLAGDSNCYKRHLIYKYMLKHMPDDDKLTTMNRLCYEVLDKFAEGNITLDVRGTSLLKETILCMGGHKDMHVKFCRGYIDDDSKEEPSDEYTFKTLSQKIMCNYLVKKNFIEHVVPILLKLNKKLDSNLSAYLMKNIKEMMKPYKNEIKDIFAADPALATELENGMQHVKSHTLQDELLEMGLLDTEVNDFFSVFQDTVFDQYNDVIDQL